MDGQVDDAGFIRRLARVTDKNDTPERTDGNSTHLPELLDFLGVEEGTASPNNPLAVHPRRTDTYTVYLALDVEDGGRIGDLYVYCAGKGRELNTNIDEHE
jgi:hypothetical protein